MGTRHSQLIWLRRVNSGVAQIEQVLRAYATRVVEFGEYDEGASIWSVR